MTLDRQILEALRSCASGISGADLAARVKVTRAAIWARMEELRRLGYEIEATPHRGYRLLATPDALHADDLLARLGATQVVGRVVQVFEKTTSTNDLADRLGRDGAEEGAVLLAESQSGGRGRLGRTWHSPPRRGLWLSILLRPALTPQAVTRITVLAAVAARQAVQRETGLVLEIKWPNDLLLRGRKCAGILVEMSAETDRVRYVVVGVGLDVNQQAVEWPPELRTVATSLRMELGRPIDRAGLAVAFLRALDKGYAQLRRGEFGSIAEEWEAACTTMGRRVVISVGQRRLSGRAESLDPDGALLVRNDHGHLERVTGGDVAVERPGS